MIRIKIYRHLPFERESIFSLLKDVESYPFFLPFITKVIIVDKKHDFFTAIMDFSYALYHGSFLSEVTLSPPSLIQATSEDGPIKRLHQKWLLEEAPPTQKPWKRTGHTLYAHTHLCFILELELKSWLLEKAANRIIHSLADTYVDAFEKRAYQLFKHKNFPF
jgi:coenzyme Q-binding protein COQ10